MQEDGGDIIFKVCVVVCVSLSLTLYVLLRNDTSTLDCAVVISGKGVLSFGLRWPDLVLRIAVVPFLKRITVSAHLWMLSFVLTVI